MNIVKINRRTIGPGAPVYIIAEMSANHGQDLIQAKTIIQAMKAAGADAVKLQTYTPDTMTLDSDRPEFRIGKGTIWEGKKLYDLYGEASTPWEWHAELQQLAHTLGMDFFSTPFDASAVEFLETLHVPAYKIASFELTDLPLIERIAATGKPLILSTGMSTLPEIEEAVDAFRVGGGEQLVLLKCTSAYPAPAEAANLQTIPDLSIKFDVPVGLSDHTMDIAVPVAAVALGACVIEKHFTLSRADSGPDSVFSLEPHEFKTMVEAVRTAEKALGKPSYEVTKAEEASRIFRRSVFAIKDIAAGEALTEENVRIIRPAHGLPPKELQNVLGKKAKQRIERGTPLSYNLLA